MWLRLVGCEECGEGEWCVRIWGGECRGVGRVG